MNGLLDGSNPTADARLLADIHASDVALNALDRISNGEFGSDVTPQEQVLLLRDVARKAIGKAAANDLRKIRGTEDEAPDPFDGGCPADVEPRTSYQAAVMADATSLRKALSNGHTLSERIGVKSAIIWLMSNGHMDVANALDAANERGEVLE
jgi:hypothetical protein